MSLKMMLVSSLSTAFDVPTTTGPHQYTRFSPHSSLMTPIPVDPCMFIRSKVQKSCDEAVSFSCSSESKHSTNPEEGTISTRNATREYRYIGSSLTAGMCCKIRIDRAVLKRMRRRISRREHLVLSQWSKLLIVQAASPKWGGPQKWSCAAFSW